uniref:PPPDE domain-containing protein n=1 Tax=Alexandrium monilatum TaxID=311494 RepID=A0A7S4UVY4_9DINO
MGGVHASPGEYQEPCLPEGVLEVRLSVYKLGFTGFGYLDSLGASIAGAYHSGVVVGGEEWSYGGHDEEHQTGVYRGRPEVNPEYMFYQRIIIAQVNLARHETTKLVRKLAAEPEWSGARYDLIEHNCNHFASDLCWLLAKKRPPEWVNETAELLAKRRRRKRAESSALAEALSEYRTEHAPAEAPPRRSAPQGGAADEEPGAEPEADPCRGRDAPGAVAFQDTFITTFELVWSERRQRRRALLAACPQGQDPRALRLQMEKESSDAAAAAATNAAWVVAGAARAAALARAEQPAAGLRQWDAAWAQQSGPLLRRWREAAVQGRLAPSGAAEREAELGTALAAAAAAAAAAAEAARFATELPAAEDLPEMPAAPERPPLAPEAPPTADQGVRAQNASASAEVVSRV